MSSRRRTEERECLQFGASPEEGTRALRKAEAQAQAMKSDMPMRNFINAKTLRKFATGVECVGTHIYKRRTPPGKVINLGINGVECVTNICMWEYASRCFCNRATNSPRESNRTKVARYERRMVERLHVAVHENSK